MLSANFTLTPLSGYVYADDFVFTDTTTTDNKIIKRTWDLGDGTFIYNQTSVTKSYNYPGTYTIGFTATDLNGDVSTQTAQVVTDYLSGTRDRVVFEQLPGSYADPGEFTETPFRVKVVTTQIDQPVFLNLFAANSQSTPLQFVPEHWNFLTPTWYFTDKNYNFVTSLSVETTPVYYNNRVVALTGIAEFYYVDGTVNNDPLTQCPVIITATLETSGFSYPQDSNVYPYSSHSNNKIVAAAIPWRVNYLQPNYLKVTENYLTDIFPQKWKDIKIPFIISCHNKKGDKISNILFSYPSTNYYGSLSSVDVALLSSNNFTVDEAPLYFKATDNNNIPTGGFIFTTITPTSAIDTTAILVSTVANYPSENIPEENEFPYPLGIGINTNTWISNPEQNTISKIFIDTYPDNCDLVNYYKNNNLLFDGSVTTTSVPKKQTTDTYNYATSGYSGIYGMAVDPTDFSVIAADAELDRLYRLTTAGTILSTYSLSSLKDYIPNKKVFHTWSWVAPIESLSATYFTFYSPTLVSTNPNDYILIAGGIHQPKGIVDIDPVRNALLLKIDPPYVPFNVKVDLIEIFDPQLPQIYTSSITNWLTSTPEEALYIPLTGAITLKTDPNYYIVSVDGVLQTSDTYIIDDSTNTLILTAAAPSNATISVTYLPSIYPPANWRYKYPYPVQNITLNYIPNFQNDPLCEFIVNVGGAFQAPNSYNYNSNNLTLSFNDPIPADVSVSVTQVSVSGDVYLAPSYTPAYVSLDQQRNIWVSLFNTISVLKFDPNFNLLDVAIPTNISWPQRNFTVSPPQNYQASIFGDTITPLTSADYFVNDFFLKPPIIETDKDSNIWTTYANPLCSLLVKFNSNGASLYEIPLPENSVPVGLAITKQNNVWVSNSYNTSLSGGSIQLYSTTGTLMSTLSGFTRPGYITIDKFNNVWFTYGLREIGYLNTTTSETCAWYLSADSNTFLPIELSAYPLYEDEELGGLAVDVYNRVWVIDSVNNKTFVFPATSTITNIRTVKILPESNIGYVFNDQTFETKIVENIGFKSAQATGDWTGNRWYQKYYTENTSSRVLTGVSTFFSVQSFENPAQIYRKNENFNTAEYFKSLALPENLYQNTNFFDNFLGAVVGNSVLSANEDLGLKVYERIANFTQNFSDIDTCNINQIMSFADQTNTPYINYNSSFPADIQKYLDISSIPKLKLWGIQTPVPLSSESIGAQLDVKTALITAGSKIYLKNKFNGSYSLYNIPLSSIDSTLPIQQQTVFPLSTLPGTGLIQPFLQNYLFYEYTPVYSNTFIDNIIDWTNPNTTLSPYLSTTDDWSGELGAIEKAFNYLLTKNLLVK